MVIYMKTNFCLMSISICLLSSGLFAAVSPQQLRCEYRVNPLGVDVAQPRLSWIIVSDDPALRGVAQCAYQVLAASSREALTKDEGDLWDSGRVNSSQTLHIEYNGKPLATKQDVFWKVRVWTTAITNTGDSQAETASAWSEPAMWSMGLLKQTDRRAQWIGDGQPCRELTRGEWSRPATHLRREFTLDKPIAKATALVSGLGMYEFYVNGQRIGQQQLAPEYTIYRDRIQYNMFDVTEVLQNGVNAAGAVVGDGWHNNDLAFAPPPPKRPFEGRRGFYLEMEIKFTDGQKQQIVSDTAWTWTTEGPIRANSIYNGEIYDARRELDGWASAGYDDSTWKPAVYERFFGAKLVWQRNEPISIVEDHKPVSVKSPESGVYQFDMGQNMVGWCWIRVHGETGQQITIRHAEMLDEKGRLFTRNLGTDGQPDTYILKGETQEYYSPRFTYHGFRYVEVSGVKGEMTLEDLTGKVIYSAARQTGWFECSDAMVNQLMSNIFWTQRANMYGMPTDCPQRTERTGWMGDIQAFAQTAMFNMDMAPFLSKWAIDVRDSQADDGRFPDMAPSPHEAGEVNLGPGWGTFYGAPAWGDAGVFVPWDMYVNYADVRLAEEHFSAMKRWVDFVHSYNPDYLWRRARGNNYNDWLNGDTLVAEGWPTKGGEIPREVFATAFYARSTQRVAEFAAILGKTDVEKEYRQRHQNICDAFVKTFIDSEGVIQGNTQAGYALALAYDILPENRQAKAVELMIKSLEPYNGHLSTGIQSTKRFMQELTRRGHHEEAGRILRLDTCPSWGHAIKEGATTIWERWDGYLTGRGFHPSGMNSFNHWALGSVGEWVWQHLAGINPDPDHPGYSHFVLQPRPIEGLTWARGKYECVRGRIVSDWKIENGTFTYTVEVPANTTATVILPKAVLENVRENQQPLTQTAGVTQCEQIGNEVHCQVVSGKYQFQW